MPVSLGADSQAESFHLVDRAHRQVLSGGEELRKLQSTEIGQIHPLLGALAS